MNEEQKREHFRIVYPVGQYGKILIKKHEYDVIDISQQGVKFALGRRGLMEEWDVGSIIKGSISLLHGARVVVSGRILRIHDDDSAVLLLDEPIELKNMYDEHRFVIQKFAID